MEALRLPGEQNQRLEIQKVVIKLAIHPSITLISATVGLGIENQFWLEGPTGKRHYFHDDYSQVGDIMKFRKRVQDVCITVLEH